MRNVRLDIHAARAAIETIRALDLEKVSIDDVKHLLNPVFRGYIARAPGFDPGLKLFRARIWEKPVALSEVWYPRADLVRIGRANHEQSPLLYCSTLRETAVFEVQPAVGDTIAILHLRTTRKMRANHIGYSPAVFARLGSNRSVAPWGRQTLEMGGPQNQEVANFMAEAFATVVPRGEEYRYKLTIALADQMFSSADVFDALVYPTIQMRANTDNFAIKPRFADVGLAFERVEFVRVDEVLEFAYRITVIDTADTLTDGAVIGWKGHIDRWTLKPGDEAIVTVQNGRWVVRNRAGIVVKPD